MQVDSKPWYLSISLWGVMITLMAAGFGALGMNIGPDTTQAAIDIVPKAVEAIQLKNWIELISLIVGLAGTIMTSVGRTAAVQPIHFLTPFKTSIDHLVKPAS